MSYRITPWLSAVVLLCACETAPAPQADRAPQAAEAATTESGATPSEAALPALPTPSKLHGDPVNLVTTTELQKIVEDPASFDGQTVRTEGRVSAVCQTRGCWMQLSDESGDVHIKMAGHAFFVPTDSKGRRAAVQGTVVPGESEDTCKSQDGCRANAEAETGKVAKLEIVATGVEFLD